jgi:hypothetical protein
MPYFTSLLQLVARLGGPWGCSQTVLLVVLMGIGAREYRNRACVRTEGLENARVKLG